MRQVDNVRGEMQDFVSKIEFALNFEDHRDSVKVRVGDVVQYDGLMAKYTTGAGQEVIGRTPSLQAAINNDWLELKAPGKKAKVSSKSSTSEPKNKTKSKTYDDFKGGEFDEFVRQKMGSTFNKEVIPEEDLVVKDTDFEARGDNDQESSEGKLEVAGDQVAVKEISEPTTVSSSTAVPKKRSHNTKVIQSEDYGADSTQPMQTKKQASGQPKKRKTFTVDDTTPAVQEGASKEEIARAKGIVDAEESQDAQVVGKIKEVSKERTVDGITMRKSKRKSSGDTQDRRVVKKIGKLSSKAQVKGSTPITDVAEGQEGVKVVAKTSKAAPNYLDQMPDDWGSLHWVKKEKFIKGLDDPDFIRFILRVETVKAVQKACKTRLDELGQKTSG